MTHSPNKRKRKSTYLLHPVVWSILVLTVIIVTGIAAYESDAVETWLQKWSTLLSAIVSAVFTIGLLALYKQQKDLKEAEYRPTIRYEGFRERDDLIEILLSNIGSAPALNLRTRTEVKSVNGSLDGVYTNPAEETLIREYEEGDGGASSDESNPNEGDKLNSTEDVNWIRNSRNYLNAEERFKRFIGGYAIKIDERIIEEERAVRSSWSERNIPFLSPAVAQRTIFYLSDILDGQLLRVTVTLLWEDSLGNQYSEEIIDDVIPMSSEFSRNRMVTSAETFEHYQEYVDDDEEIFNNTNIHRKYVAEQVIEQDEEDE